MQPAAIHFQLIQSNDLSQERIQAEAAAHHVHPFPLKLTTPSGALAQDNPSSVPSLLESLNIYRSPQELEDLRAGY